MKEKSTFLRVMCTVLVVCISCATVAPTVPHELTMTGKLEEMKGKKYNLAYIEFGPPDAIYSDGADGRIIEWDRSVTNTSAGVSVSTANVTSTETDIFASGYTVNRPPVTSTDYQFIQVYVKPDSTIYHFRHNTLSIAERDAELELEKIKKQQDDALLWGMLIGVVVLVTLSASVSADEY